MVNRRAGYSLLEVVIAMALFGIFVLVALSLTMELANYERKLKVDFLRHPQIIAVIARMRRDVLDGFGTDPYRETYDVYTMSPKTLIIETLHQSASSQIVVWDFSTPGVVVRRAYKTGQVRQWRARGLPPEFTAETKIESVQNPNPNGAWGVRLKALDSKGQVAIDQVFFPRTTK